MSGTLFLLRGHAGQRPDDALFLTPENYSLRCFKGILMRNWRHRERGSVDSVVNSMMFTSLISPANVSLSLAAPGEVHLLGADRSHDSIVIFDRQ